ncbi:MAG: tetratricopeptide repeat protein, partial [Armatimonadota bacterium]
LGKTAYARGDYDQAQEFYSESLEIQRKLGIKGDIALTLHLMAGAANSQRDFEKALSLYGESIRLCREMDDKEGMAENLSRLPAILVALSEPRKAAHLMGAADALRNAIGFAPPPRDREAIDRLAATLRAALGTATFNLAWEDGNSLTREQAAACALGEALPDIQRENRLDHD